VIPEELGASAFWIVVALGALLGALSVRFLRRWSDAADLRTAINHIWAHLMEFQLFSDEPGLILRAQRDLLIANANMLGLLVVPTLILAVPFAMLVAAADSIFARAPLPVGKATVVTVRIHGSLSKADAMRLEAPPGIQVETPPVRIPIESAICWRVRADGPSSGDLEVIYAGRAFSKSISAKPGLQWLSERRFESPFSAAGLKSIEVRYPPATVFQWPWFVWFAMASIVGAVISTLRLGGPPQ
jgi:hypothetical protein